jgi:hypothetical protein
MVDPKKAHQTGCAQIHTVSQSLAATHFLATLIPGRRHTKAYPVSTTSSLPPKSETGGPKPESSSKSEVRRRAWKSAQAAPEASSLSDFELRISFGFRASDFGFGRLAYSGTCKLRPTHGRVSRLAAWRPSPLARSRKLTITAGFSSFTPIRTTSTLSGSG